MIYHYNGGKLEYEEHFNSGATLQEVLKYTYDTEGNVEYLLYKDNNFSNASAFDLYYYVRDGVDNITDIFQLREQNGSSTTVVNRLAAHYEYDPYGNILSVDTYNNDNIGNINPIRYKGYYYYLQTGWYQLGSRFYDSETGRFLNADGYASTGQGISGTNMYAYCGDNPVNRTDPSGKSWKKIKNFFKKASKTIARFAKRTFGARYSKIKTSIGLPDLTLKSYYPINAQSGTNTTTTLSSSGSSSKPISVYFTVESEDPFWSSSYGSDVNISNFTLNTSVGLNNLGFSGSVTRGNNSSSFGPRINIKEGKIGFEYSSSATSGNITETSYTDISLTGTGILALTALALVHLPAPTFFSAAFAY